MQWAGCTTGCTVYTVVLRWLIDGGPVGYSNRPTGFEHRHPVLTQLQNLSCNTVRSQGMGSFSEPTVLDLARFIQPGLKLWSRVELKGQVCLVVPSTPSLSVTKFPPPSPPFVLFPLPLPPIQGNPAPID